MDQAGLQWRRHDRLLRGDHVPRRVARPINVFHSTRTSQTIVSLTNGRTYTFKVAAHNATGWSRLSAESGPVLIGVPGPPSNVFATPGSNQVQISWATPSITSGSAIVAYRITPRTGTKTLATRTYSWPATTEVVTGLTNGTVYSFDVGRTRNESRVAPPSPESPTYRRACAARRPTCRASPVTARRRCRGMRRRQPTARRSRPTGSRRISGRPRRRRRPSTGPRPREWSPRSPTARRTGSGSRLVMPTGWSPRSAASPLVTIGVPGVPTGVTAVPASGPARVSSRRARHRERRPSRPRTRSCRTATVLRRRRRCSLSPALSQIVRGLGHGVPFRFRVAAHNSPAAGARCRPRRPLSPRRRRPSLRRISAWVQSTRGRARRAVGAPRSKRAWASSCAGSADGRGDSRWPRLDRRPGPQPAARSTRHRRRAHGHADRARRDVWMRRCLREAVTASPSTRRSNRA